MEQLYNYETSSIDDVNGLDHAATSMTLSTAFVVATTPNFRIGIDDEICLVTAVAGAVLTISRGEEGSVAMAHKRGTTVAVIQTAAGTAQFVADRYTPL